MYKGNGIYNGAVLTAVLFTAPASVGVVLLGKVDQAGEGEHGHAHQQHQQAQLLVGLCKRKKIKK